MYLATGQPVRRARRRRTLGQDDTYYGEGTDFPTGSEALTKAAHAPTESWIPGSGWSDYLWNAATGHPTDAQITYNTNSCVQAIQNMPGLTPEAKAMAQARCTSDQQAYTKLIGGTAQQVLSPGNLLAGILPGSDISTWAWLILGGVVGVIVLTRR